MWIFFLEWSTVWIFFLERIGAEVAGFRGRLPLLCRPTARTLAGAALLLAAGAAAQAAKARARGFARPLPTKTRKDATPILESRLSVPYLRESTCSFST